MKKVNALLLCLILAGGFVVLTGCPRPEEPMIEPAPEPMMEPVPYDTMNDMNEMNDLHDMNDMNDMNHMNEMNEMPPVDGEPIS
jgi:hypothetical protein